MIFAVHFSSNCLLQFSEIVVSAPFTARKPQHKEVVTDSGRVSWTYMCQIQILHTQLHLCPTWVPNKLSSSVQFGSRLKFTNYFSDLNIQLD